MQKLLNDLIEKHRKITEQGKVASYIPELEKSNPHDLGIYVLDNNGNEYFAGDYNVKFTVQSISKVVALMLAILDNGEEYVFSKVGMDPSGDPFNSIRKLETSSRRKPYNPMINAGAIVVSSMIKGDDSKHKFNRLLEFFKKITEDSTLELNPKVYLSEAETGNKNRAMGYYLKAEGIITGNVEDALEIYFKQCSIDVTAKTIAKLGLFLANEGKLSSGEQVVSERVSRIVKTLMVTCG
ncbi:MAG: glutaminase A, partial [Cetobacterium sp.]